MEQTGPGAGRQQGNNSGAPPVSSAHRADGPSGGARGGPGDDMPPSPGGSPGTGKGNQGIGVSLATGNAGARAPGASADVTSAGAGAGTATASSGGTTAAAAAGPVGAAGIAAKQGVDRGTNAVAGAMTDGADAGGKQ